MTKPWMEDIDKVIGRLTRIIAQLSSITSDTSKNKVLKIIDSIDEIDFRELGRMISYTEEE